MIEALFFYLFSAIAIASGVMVISARNPVHSVLFLILAFVNAAALFIMLGAEFLALLLVVVYVGAVAVLFLFVVMMLDVDFAELKKGFLQHLPFGLLIGIVVLAELLFVVGAWVAAPASGVALAVPIPHGSNIAALGALIYTHYVFFFETAALILLVAMVGAITLTLRHRAYVKRQDIAAQVARRPETAIEVRKVVPRQGL